MCDPVTAGLLISAVGGGASAINNDQALRRKDKQAAAGIRANSQRQGEANTRVNEQIDEIAANTGEAERTASLSDFQNALRSSADSRDGSLQGVSGANDRFAERVSQGKQAVTTRGNDKAQNLSIIDGILRQRQNEGINVGRTGSDLSEIGRQVSAEDFLTRLRVQGEQPNGLINALAGIAQGVGNGLTARGPKSAKPSAVGPAIAPIINPLFNGRDTVLG
jgi:hypothetical protein